MSLHTVFDLPRRSQVVRSLCGGAEVPPPTPDVVPLPPSPHPLPPSPAPVPPEISEPPMPGQNVPVRDPSVPGDGKDISVGGVLH